MKSMKDAIKEGVMQRNNFNLKMCITVFYRQSNLSKYMEESFESILKTEAMLPERMTLKEKANMKKRRKYSGWSAERK